MTTTLDQRPTWPARNDLAIGALIAILSFAIGFASRNFVDIGLYDESYYLQSGIDFAKGSFPEASWAPLYAFWYSLLHSVSADPVSTYYLNYAVLSALSTLFLYAFLRISRISRLGSLAWASLFMLSSANIPAWPKVSSLALVFILAAVCASSILFSRLGKISVAITCTTLLTFLRPEFAVTMAGSLFLGVAFILQSLCISRHLARRDLLLFAVSAGICIALITIFGNPLNGSRSMVAFGQHFSLHYVKWNDLELNPWTNWDFIVSKSFGDVSSITGALIANPALFSRHIISNIALLPIQLCKLFFPWLLVVIRDNTIILRALSAKAFMLAGSGFILALTTISYLKGCRGKDVLNLIRRSYYSIVVQAKALAYLLLFVASIPILTSVVIYPRTHYLVMLLPFAILVGAIVTDDWAASFLVPLLGNSGRISLKRSHIVGAYLLLSILMITATSRITTPRHNVELITSLRAMKLRPSNILETYGGIDIYLGDGFERVAEYDKSREESCSNFISRKSVGLIIANNALINDTRFKGSEDCKSIELAASFAPNQENDVAIIGVDPEGRLKRIALISR